MTRIISSLDRILADYDALFCDLWGCVHDGVRAFPEAVSALRDFRAAGGRVALLTNAPRPRHEVAEQIAAMGVAQDAWDIIVTSGDSARAAMFQGVVGQDVYFIGEDRDLGFFEPMAEFATCPEVRRVALDAASGIVCTGPSDPYADPAAHRPELLYAKQKGLRLLCANPDIVVDRGDRREWCAGAVAALYTEMGGESLYFGKPHPPIYDLARRRLAALDQPPTGDLILAVGDGIATDIRGALGEDIDSLFVTGGLAAAETKSARDPDPDALEAFLQREMTAATYAIGTLR